MQIVRWRNGCRYPHPDRTYLTIDGHPAYCLAIHNAKTGQLVAVVSEVMVPAGKIEYRTAVNQRIGPTVASVVRAAKRR